MNKNEDKILEAALKVVKEHTISGTRMHLIAEQAQMRQSNLHYYYKTKEDLMLALQKKVLEKCLEIRADLSKYYEDCFEDQLEIFFEQKKQFILKLNEYDYAEIDFWVQSRIHNEIKNGFAKSFQNWRKEIGEIFDQYFPDLEEGKRKFLPFQVVSLLEGATIQYLVDEKCVDIDEYFHACKNLILNEIKE